jgi:hypothetical protein
LSPGRLRWGGLYNQRLRREVELRDWYVRGGLCDSKLRRRGDVHHRYLHRLGVFHRVRDGGDVHDQALSEGRLLDPVPARSNLRDRGLPGRQL